MKDKPKNRKDDPVVQEFDNEILIYDLNVNKAYCLNETARLVRPLCDGRSSVAEISRPLSQKPQSNVPEDLLRLALDQFKPDDQLDQSEEKTAGLERRKIINL